MVKKYIIVILCFSIILILSFYFKAEIETSSINYDKNIDTTSLSEKEIPENYEITEEGIYELNGEINTTITIETEGIVKLILNNTKITSTNGPAIYVKQSEAVVISLSDNSENYIIDSSNYETEDINGAIYSKDDLYFEGNGILHVIANYEDGIVSKDNLIFYSGNYQIEAKDDGIRGKDSVVIYGGTYEITADGDGIKSSNSEDSNKGYIVIEDGTFNIETTLDGIQAETTLWIKNGTFNIKTGNGSDNDSTKSTWGNWKSTTQSTQSAKGLKAGQKIQIEDGDFVINSSDDSIHSNDTIILYNGNYEISSGDDGIHADNTLVIENGTYNIIKSYEGLEASQVTINNGNISVVSSDDGINAAGGSDASSFNRKGANEFSGDGSLITINGGNIYVNASGDGIDSNGDIVMNGGTLIINGPTDNGNGAIDKDGTFTMNGGILIASGSSGMAEMPESGQNSVMINFNSTIASSNIVSIYEGETERITYQASKGYTNLVISSPILKTGETYTVYKNGTTTATETNGLYETGSYTSGNVYTSFNITSATTKIGTGNGNMNNGKNMPGRR